MTRSESSSRPALAGLLVLLALAGCDVAPERTFRLPPERPHGYPPEMEPYREAFEASALEYAAAEAELASTEPWESKLLGLPYMPRGMEYPRDPDGVPLTLLAQIHFADLPPLDDFPTEGIVQFFVSSRNSGPHVYGMPLYEGRPHDPEDWFRSMTEQGYFRVLFHETVHEDRDRLELSTPRLPEGYLPVDSEARLTFTLRTGHVPSDDYRFEKVFGEPGYPFFERFGEAEIEVWNQYDRYAHEYALAWVGGYGVFVQGDPRVVRPDEDWLLLLEMETSRRGEEVHVMWGDAGVGGFFIRREDLRRRDFSNVLYYWDNH